MVEQPVEGPGLLPAGKALLDAAVRRLRRIGREPAPLPAQRQVLVPGDLAQPHPQLALAPEAVNGGEGLEKGLLGHLLRHGLVPAEGQDVFVDIGETPPVDLLKISHFLTAFHT